MSQRTGAGPRTDLVAAQPFLDAVRAVLPNGARVIVVPVPTLRSALIEVEVRSGARDERSDELGYAHLLEHMLFKGSARYPASLAVTGAIEELGGHANAWTSAERIGIEAEVPAGSWRVAVDVCLDVLRAPLLRDDDLEPERRVVVEELRDRRDAAETQREDALLRLLFPDSRLGRPVIGTAETLARASAAGLRAFHERSVRPERVVVVVVGAVDPAAVIEAAAERLMPWSGPPPASWVTPRDIAGGELRLEASRGEQLLLGIGWRTVGELDRELRALSLLRALLSDGTGSRLFRELRERRGLVYHAGASLLTYIDCGALCVGLSLAPSRAAEARAVLRNELTRPQQGVAEDELERVKRRMIGKTELSLDAPGALAAWCLREERRERGVIRSVDEVFAELRAVTPDRLRETASRYLGAERMCEVIVGPRAELETLRLGEVSERPRD